MNIARFVVSCITLIVSLLCSPSIYAQSSPLDMYSGNSVRNETWDFLQYSPTIDLSYRHTFGLPDGSQKYDWKLMEQRARTHRLTQTLSVMQNGSGEPVVLYNGLFQKKLGYFVFGVYPLRGTNYNLPLDAQYQSNGRLRNIPPLFTENRRHPKIQFGIGLNFSF